MDSESAMDVMQEAFMRLWKAWEAGEDILNPRAWLIRVARNLADDIGKSAFRRNGTSAPQNLSFLHSQDLGPLEKILEDERFAQVRALLAELSEPDRELLTLRYALDYEIETIAEVLDIKSAAVHMRLTRARQRLAERLTAEGVQWP
jgi:RNA polymerase sigma-70 factor (ECF subfamily)